MIKARVEATTAFTVHKLLFVAYRRQRQLISYSLKKKQQQQHHKKKR